MSKRNGYIHIVIAILISVMAIGLVSAAWYFKSHEKCGVNTQCATQPTITNFTQCAKVGYPVTETYPRQCRAYGKIFTEGLPGSTNQQVGCGVITNMQACDARQDCVVSDSNCSCYTYNNQARKCGPGQVRLCEACLGKSNKVCKKLDCSSFYASANVNIMINSNANSNTNAASANSNVNVNTEAGCLSQGGAWGPRGLHKEPVCTKSTKDGGKACANGSECEAGICTTLLNQEQSDAFRKNETIQITGTCPATDFNTGCYYRVENGKVGDYLCVD